MQHLIPRIIVVGGDICVRSKKGATLRRFITNKRHPKGKWFIFPIKAVEDDPAFLAALNAFNAGLM